MEKIPKNRLINKINEEQLDQYLFSYLKVDHKDLPTMDINYKINLVIDDAVDLRREVMILKDKLKIMILKYKLKINR